MNIKKILDKYSACFASFVPSSNPNILVSHLKIDGTIPKKKRKDKTYLYIDTGVIGEQGEKPISMYEYLKSYHDIDINTKNYHGIHNDDHVYVPVFNPKIVPIVTDRIKKSKEEDKIVSKIDNYPFLPSEIQNEYFDERRGLEVDYIKDFTNKIKYRHTKETYELYIPFHEGVGYQRITLNQDYYKIKNQTRVYLSQKNIDYRTYVHGNQNSTIRVLFEGIEDALSWLFCLNCSWAYDSILQPILESHGLQNYVTKEKTSIVCCYGKTNMLKIAQENPNTLCVWDNDGYDKNIQNNNTLKINIPYREEENYPKDFNSYLIAKRYL